VGLLQEDAGREATGNFAADDSQMGHPAYLPLFGPKGVFYAGKFTPGGPALVSFPDHSGDETASGSGRIEFALSRAWGTSHIAEEFRPLNVAILYCIKHD
jgi:hypothetical protein